jgi:hypothetical protein
MTYLEKAIERFGRFAIDVFGPESFRIAIWDRHSHFSLASYGTLTGYGSTIEKAAEALMREYDRGMTFKGGCCDAGCPHWQSGD